MQQSLREHHRQLVWDNRGSQSSIEMQKKKQDTLFPRKDRRSYNRGFKKVANYMLWRTMYTTN